MNRSFKSVFNRRTGTWQVVSEKVRNAGKTGGSVSLPALAVVLGLAGIASTADAQITYSNGENSVTPISLSAGITQFEVRAGEAATQSGAITQTSSGQGIEKIGTGTLTLNGVNTYSGGTTLTGGTLAVGADTSLGTGTLTSNAGTSLDSNRAVSLANGVVLNGNLDVPGSRDLALTGNISGAGGMTKSGSARLTLSGNNSYQGPTNLNGGILVLGNDSALGAGALNVGGNAILGATSAVSINNLINLNGDLIVNSNADLSLNGLISGSHSLTTTGHGTLYLDKANTYSGGTTLVNGTLRLGNNLALGSGTVTVAGSGAIDSDSAINLANRINLNGALTLGGSNDTTLNGAIAGTGALLKTGAGTLTLNGSSNYSGGTTLTGGTLLLGNNNSLGNGVLNISGAGTFLDAANNTGVAIANAIALGANNLIFGGSNQFAVNGTITGTGSLLKSGLAMLTLSGNNTFSGGVRLNAGVLELASATGLGSGALTSAGGILNNTVSASLNNAVHLLGTLTLSGAQSLALNGVINGSGNLAKTGIGNLLLTGNNTYTGNTFLLGGTTTLGSNTAFGTGNITTGNTGLDSSTAVTLANNFSVLGNLVIGGTSDLTLNGAVHGAAGSVIKNGAGTLTLNGSNSFSAGALLNAGTLAVGQNGSLGSGKLTVGGSSTLVAANNGLALSNDIQTDSRLTVGGANNLTLNSVISGNGSLVKTGTSTLTLNGANSYNNGTTLNGGVVVVGNSSAFGTGSVVANAGNTATTVRNTQTRILNNTFVVDGNLTLDTPAGLQFLGALNGSGTLTKTGGNEVLLLSAGNFNGDIDVLAGYVTAFATNALGDLRSASLAAGSGLTVDGNINIDSLTGQGVMRISNGQVSVGGNNLDGVFAGTVTDTGGLNKVGASVLELTGTSNNTGVNTVSAGTLKVTGSLNGSGGLNVDAGATLTGGGSINGTTTIADGATLVGYSGQKLTFNNLVLSQDSSVDFNLGSLTTSGDALFNVNSTLTMAGTFNIADFGGLGNGVYRLFDYGGSLTDNGVTFGDLPTGVDVSELTLVTGVGNQVNLLVGSPNLVIQFWDGVDTTSNGLVEGSSGVWDNTTANWAEYDGLGNLDWQGQFAVFQGATGTVTVDGQQNVNGMQFMTDGYQLVAGTNGSLNISNRNGSYFAVRVDNGVTSTLDLPLEGDGTLTKLDVGTLVLNGVNSYTGGTTLNGGTLVLGNDSALGSGGLTTAAGATLDSNQAVIIGNNVAATGALNLAGSNDLTLNGVVSGTGSLAKNGNGFLTLRNTNTFLGGLKLNAGRLILGANGSLGTGALTAANGTSMDSQGALTLGNTVNLAGNLLLVGNNDLTLNGPVNGVGSLTKQGISTLTLNAVNAFTGGVNLASGQIRLGNDRALGSGTLSVTGASQLDTNSAMSLANNVLLNAKLTLGSSNDLTLNGVLSGSASLVKDGLGSLTLNGANNFSGGLTINSSSLILGNAAALGSGRLSVTGNSQLHTTRAISLANAVDVSGSLLVGGNNNLTLNGVLSGTGTLNKNGNTNLTLGGTNTFAGILNILSGSLTATNGGALGSPTQINLSSGTLLNVSGTTSLGALAGIGDTNIASGATLTLSSGIFGGKLIVDGNLASNSVTINSGAHLSGSGNLLGAVTIANGGNLDLQSGNALKVGSLTFDNNANLNTALGAALRGAPALLNVAGDLTLDGNLNVTDAGGFGAGVYRLANYGGTLTDNGLSINSLPGNIDASDVLVQTVVNKQVNLIVGGSENVLFWDGKQTADNNSIDGGFGVWDATNTNWTSSDGSLNQTWNNTFAVFQGTGDIVAVNGSHTINGMQFVGNGYTLNDGIGGELLTSAGASNLRVDSGNTATLGVAINGTGTLTKLDGGTLVLNTANGYSGGTALKGGTLIVGNDAALGSGDLITAAGTTLDSNTAVTLANNAVLDGGLRIGGSNALTLDGFISGNGSLIKNGSANLTLNGVNTYSSGTTLNGGSLTLGNNDAIGSGNLTVNADATLNSGTATALDNGLHLAGNLTVNGADFNLNGAITGIGGLVKSSIAILTLNGNNDYTGGTRIDAGTLQIGNGGTSGSIVGDIENNSTLAFNRSNALGFSGVISGTGKLVQEGNGTLILTGDTIHTGGTSITSGTLQIGNGGTSGRIVGDVTNNGTLTFNRSDALSFGGVISGTGGLIKDGEGTLTLTSTSTYTGTTHINSGTLAVNGGLKSSAITVNSGGALGGNGTVGSVTVASGGVINPGNSIGTLTINGDLTFASGAIYQVEVDADGNHDQLIVKGNATLGGSVLALAQNGNYRANTAYTILASDNAVQGRFNDVASTLTFLNSKLDYSDPNKVNLILSRNTVGYGDISQTRNQHNIGEALERSIAAGGNDADMDAVITTINNLSADQARAAFDSMSGAGLVALQRTATGFAGNFSNQLMVRLQTVGMSRTAQSINGMQLAANDRLNDLLPALAQNTRSDVSPSSFTLGGGVPVDDGKRGFWLRGFGSDQDTSGDGNAAGTRVQSAGVSAGFDARVRDDLVVGAAFSYSDADVRASFAETGETRSSAVAVYASYTNGPWTINGNLMLAHNSNEMDRNITVGTLNRTAHARFDSKTVSAYGEASYDLPQASWTLQPLAGLAVLHNRNDGFTETGAGALNIQADAQSMTSTRTLFGARALFDLDGINVQPRAIWAHEFGDVNKGMTAQLQGAPAASFTTYGVDLPRDSLIAGITVAGRTTNGLSLFADVQGEFNSKQTGLGLLVGLRKSW